MAQKVGIAIALLLCVALFSIHCEDDYPVWPPFWDANVIQTGPLECEMHPTFHGTIRHTRGNAGWEVPGDCVEVGHNGPNGMVSVLGGSTVGGYYNLKDEPVVMPYAIDTHSFVLRWRQEDPECALEPGETYSMELAPVYYNMDRVEDFVPGVFDVLWRWAPQSSPGRCDGLGTSLHPFWWPVSHGLCQACVGPGDHDQQECLGGELIDIMEVTPVNCTFEGPE